jgi:hypothetical protein
MYSIKEQYSIIKKVILRDNSSKRIDCPFCGGYKTLSLSKMQGRFLWNCYKASCPAKGVKDDKLSLSSIKSRLSTESIGDRRRSNPNEIPPILSSVENNPRAIKYLKEVNCWNVYQTHQVHIKYTAKEDRVLFFMNNNTGAVGRYIGDPPTNKKYKISKWKVYGDTTGCFIIGEGNHAVVVEDIPSACVVSTIPGYVGVALLGTNVEHKQRQQLQDFKKITFALDKDARKKSIDASNKFFFGVQPSVLLLEEDIKYINKDKLYNLLSDVI